MNSSRRRHAGGAWRQKETMIAAHAKEGKDRTKAKRNNPAKHRHKKK